MDDNNDLEYRLSKVAFYLSEEDIYSFEKEDNGPISAVIRNIARHSFGVRLLTDAKGYIAEMYYITKEEKLSGEIISIYFDDPNYFSLLLAFCHDLTLRYPSLDAIDTFNIFQKKLQLFFEKIGYTTITDLELENFKGQEVVVASATKGFKLIRLIDKVEYYRKYLNQNPQTKIKDNTTYVYLMVNIDTSLIKIGFSKNPAYRKRTLHSKEPSVFIIAKWIANIDVERMLHKTFSKKRTRGEWFKLNLADLSEIEKLMTIYGI